LQRHEVLTEQGKKLPEAAERIHVRLNQVPFNQCYYLPNAGTTPQNIKQ
jgi:hypothetical protein